MNNLLRIPGWVVGIGVLMASIVGAAVLGVLHSLYVRHWVIGVRHRPCRQCGRADCHASYHFDGLM